jgi:hypothetical protein
MIDRYSLEKIIDGHGADAVKAAAQERLASQAAAARRVKRPAAVRSAAARLYARALASARRLEAAAEHLVG